MLLAFGSVWAGPQENDLIRLARSGVDAEVLKAYVDVARGPYHLTVDQIIELNKLGVSSKVISEAIQHRGNAETTPVVVPNESPSVPAAPPVATAADTPTVISAPEEVVYPDPYYYYDYWPYIGLGWGWGWGPNYYGWAGRAGYYGRGPGLRASAGFRSGGQSGRGAGGGSRAAGGGGSRAAGGGGSRGGGGRAGGGGHR